MDGMLKNRAFTLVEILLVVILLGILAAVVIPLYWDSQTDARIARAQTDISVLNRQLALYNSNNNTRQIKNRTNYRRAVRLLTRAGYIKSEVEAPDGFQYQFDRNMGLFTYSEVGKRGGDPDPHSRLIDRGIPIQ